MFGKDDAFGNKIKNLVYDMRNKKTTKYQNLVVIIGGSNSQSEQTFYYRLYEEKFQGMVGGYMHTYGEFYNNFVNMNQGISRAPNNAFK